MIEAIVLIVWIGIFILLARAEDKYVNKHYKQIFMRDQHED